VHDVINHVLEPTSILVTRGARRAKTDRLDPLGLLRVLAATFTADHDACGVVKVPSVSEEDGKRPHREHEYLVQERVRIENRIAALLTTQGISKRKSLRSWEAGLPDLLIALAQLPDDQREVLILTSGGSFLRGSCDYLQIPVGTITIKSRVNRGAAGCQNCSPAWRDLRRRRSTLVQDVRNPTGYPARMTVEPHRRKHDGKIKPR
jgi:DNA-directed RNA polymerase specialized sigma24 family protein